MANEKELKQKMNEQFKPWEESREIRDMAHEIYDSGKIMVSSPHNMKFYLTTGVKELVSKKSKVSIVKGILSVYLPEVLYVVEIDRSYWNDLSDMDKYLLITRTLLSCGMDENSKPKIYKPDIQEYKELVVENYLDLSKVGDMIRVVKQK